MFNKFIYFLFRSKSVQNQENFDGWKRNKIFRWKKKKKYENRTYLFPSWSLPFDQKSWKNQGSDKFYPRIIVTREDHFFFPRLGKSTDLTWRPCFSGIVTTLIKLRSTVKRRLFRTSTEYAYSSIYASIS